MVSGFVGGVDGVSVFLRNILFCCGTMGTTGLRVQDGSPTAARPGARTGEQSLSHRRRRHGLGTRKPTATFARPPYASSEARRRTTILKSSPRRHQIRIDEISIFT